MDRIRIDTTNALAGTVGARVVTEMELAVAVLGEHYDVDAFDQPGAEAGQVAARALRGRSGSEGRRAEIEARADRPVRAV